MEDYYKILHHLREFKVDRQYPYSFESSDNVKPSCQLVAGSVHINLLRFTGMTDDVIVIPTLQRDYFSIDSVEIKLTPGSELDPSKSSLGFHDTMGAEVTLLTLQGSGDIISAGQSGAVTFKVNDQGMDPKSQLLSGIKSLSIHLDTTLDSLDIIDIIFRNNSPVCTLESLDLGLIDGENYVRDGLQTDTLPESLLKYKYIAAAAMTWLTRWEHEGQVMGDGTQKSKNYADRLLGIVDRAIDTYKNTPADDNIDDGINEDLIGFSLI
jgi:hypothetical protein